MDTLTDLLAPDALRPPAELAPVDGETVVPAMSRVRRPPRPDARVPTPAWSLVGTLLAVAGAALLR